MYLLMRSFDRYDMLAVKNLEIQHEYYGIFDNVDTTVSILVERLNIDSSDIEITSVEGGIFILSIVGDVLINDANSVIKFVLVPFESNKMFRDVNANVDFLPGIFEK